MEIIKKIATEKKQTIVMVTHDVNMAKYANKIVHIHDGHIEKIVEVNENEKRNETRKPRAGSRHAARLPRSLLLQVGYQAFSWLM